MDEHAEATIAAVYEWQRDARVRPLMCGKDAGHRPLEPLAVDGRVILRCPDCDYRQAYIPASVLHAFRTGALQNH